MSWRQLSTVLAPLEVRRTVKTSVPERLTTRRAPPKAMNPITSASRHSGSKPPMLRRPGPAQGLARTVGDFHTACRAAANPGTCWGAARRLRPCRDRAQPFDAPGDRRLRDRARRAREVRRPACPNHEPFARLHIPAARQLRHAGACPCPVSPPLLQPIEHWPRFCAGMQIGHLLLLFCILRNKFILGKNPPLGAVVH